MAFAIPSRQRIGRTDGIGTSVGPSGTLRVVSNAQLKQAEDEAGNAEYERYHAPEEPLIGLAQHVEKVWDKNQRAKLTVEQRMLANLKQRQGKYEQELLAAIEEIGGSREFDRLTATKCRAAESWILDTIIPHGSRSWGLEPTPIPDVDPEVQQKIRSQIEQQAVQEAAMLGAMTGRRADPMVLREFVGAVEERFIEEYQSLIEDDANEKAKRMELRIDDLLTEGGYYKAIIQCVRDLVTFPAAILKGPITRMKRRKKWVRANNQWMPQITREIVIEFERVSPLDIYPSDDAVDIQDGDLIERIRLSRSELTAMRGAPNYSTEAINRVLERYREGYQRWTTVDHERGQTESRHFGGKIDSDKIEALSYWGSVQGTLLLEWGMDAAKVPDPLAEYDVNVWKIDQEIIKAVLNPDPLGRRPYHKASYEEVPGAFWGNGVPDLIVDDQVALNTVYRALINNAGMTSGPLVWIDTERIPNDDGRMYAWKHYYAGSSTDFDKGPPLGFHNIQSAIPDMLNLRESIIMQADEHSGVPAYAHGQTDVGGAGNTSSGLSMLMNASSKLLRMAILHFDQGVVESSLTQVYDHVMLNDPDQSIKGDLRIVPKGAGILLIREQMAVRQAEFANQTNNPIDLQIMGIGGRRKLLEHQAGNLGMDVDELFPEEEIPAAQGPMGPMGQPPGPGQPQPGQGQPQTRDQAGRRMTNGPPQ